MAPTLRGVTHIMVGVSEMQRSVDFYERTLGRRVHFRADDDLAFLDGGSVLIGLSSGLGRLRQPLAGAVEIVFGVEAVKPAWRTLSEQGVPFLREPREATPGGEWTATLLDPDGHYVTLFGPPGD